MREQILALAVGVSSFMAVSGTIVGVGLATATEPRGASERMGADAGRRVVVAAGDIAPAALALETSRSALTSFAFNAPPVDRRIRTAARAGARAAF